MAESQQSVWFYELAREPAESMLAATLAKHHKRGDRVSVQCVNKAMIDDISNRLWGVEDVAFISHGSDGEPEPATQPIWLTTTDDNPNAATIRYYIEGLMPDEVGNYERISIMFDAINESERQRARDAWKLFKGRGLTVKYWKQQDGRWVDQANK
jgi:DNA polymerase III subunit chi